MSDSSLFDGTLRARAVFTGDGAVIENAVVEIERGRVSAVHNRPVRDAVDLGSSAILPAFVNAHTHLEFSHLERPLGPPRPFADWIRSVVGERRGRITERVDSIRRGFDESNRTATGWVGEIATSDAWPASYAGSGSAVFRELLGLSEDSVDAQLEIARRHLSSSPDSASRTIAGLSPHAPYSVHPRLLQGSVELAASDGAPIAMHVAETREELELLERGTGPLAEMLRGFGVWNESLFGDRDAVPSILRTLSKATRVLVVHGNYLADGSLRFLATQPHMSLVYCPRTHRYFGHDRYPLEKALALRINVALGTDSRASNPDLNLWEEAKLVAREHPSIASETVLEMATVNGAKALGLNAIAGRIVVGEPADLAIISFTESLLDPWSRVAGSMLRGHWIRVPPES